MFLDVVDVKPVLRKKAALPFDKYFFVRIRDADARLSSELLGKLLLVNQELRRRWKTWIKPSDKEPSMFSQVGIIKIDVT